ncbi:dipeptide epimerase [Halorussus amylolyticus]|uniref:dipeptide epimerase n=1 Tax=Halorussus amylolyticus TaxID=1126242 RepID=UPI001051E45B|nr:dipeptide epimerase [Halorussus amylolyticus]
MTKIVRATVEPLDLELSAPFEIALGTRHEAKNVLVRIETEGGAVGHGEGSPLPPVTGETQAAAVETARAATDLLDGREIADYRSLVGEVRAAFPGMVSALFAVETAILDAYCREREIPLSELFGGSPETVETDLTIPIVDADAARSRAASAADAGFSHIKVKTGDPVPAAVARVAAVRDAAPDAHLKVDANQGWTPKETERFVREAREAGVELDLLEQPVPKADLAGLARVRDRVSVPVAADEAVFTPEDAMAVVRADAADVLNAKLGKSGPLAVADIAAVADAANLELMVGCMLESAIGIHTSAHVVAGLGRFDYVDLDGNRLLAEDVVDDAGDGPEIDTSGPGHGVNPSNHVPRSKY